jgi:predicted Zn-dependent protease
MGAATLANPAHPAPERDIPALRRRISSGSRDTYMDAMLLHNDSMIVRWPDRYGQPVRAWIQPLPNVHGWSGNMVARARQSFAAWSSIQLPIRFEFVTDSATAEIVLVWRDQLDGARVGITRRYRDMSGWLGRAEIAIAMRTADGAAVDDKYVDGVMSHEVGHALGLDHSPERSDLMAERNEGVFEPSIRDRNTLALIYSIPPGSIR